MPCCRARAACAGKANQNTKPTAPYLDVQLTATGGTVTSLVDPATGIATPIAEVEPMPTGGGFFGGTSDSSTSSGDSSSGISDDSWNSGGGFGNDF